MRSEAITQSLFTRCAAVDFGMITSCTGRDEFYRRLNSAVTDLVRTLPRSMQTEAMLFVMAYAGLRVGDELDFFRNYYSPIWSCLWWIVQLKDTQFPDTLMDAGVRAHALAMMLHSLDDHLSDGEVPSSPLTLLVRSQAWLLMRRSIEQLEEAVPAGSALAAGLIDDYYSGITGEDEVGDLRGYCSKFEKQMATGLIVPSLLARMIENRGGVQSQLEERVRASLVRFGIAWRLLDDIRDLEEDMRFSRKTGVYFALPTEGRELWDGKAPVSKGSEPQKRFAMLAGMIHEMKIIDVLVGKIVDELLQAISHAEEAGLHGFAEEYRALLRPLLKYKAGTEDQGN